VFRPHLIFCSMPSSYAKLLFFSETFSATSLEIHVCFGRPHWQQLFLLVGQNQQRCLAEWSVLPLPDKRRMFGENTCINITHQVGHYMVWLRSSWMILLYVLEGAMWFDRSNDMSVHVSSCTSYIVRALTPVVWKLWCW
jgi:hypothetical protein